LSERELSGEAWYNGTQNVCLCVAGAQKYVLYSYVVVDWWSVTQLGRERTRGSSIGWSVLPLTLSRTHSLYLFKFEQVVI